jgi:PAS domain S-box-containing protein
MLQRHWRAIVAILVLLLGFGAYRLTQQLRAQAFEATVETLRSVATLKSAELERWRADRLAFLDQPHGGMMASQFAELQKGNVEAGENLLARLQYLHARQPEIVSIWLYDSAGQPRLGSRGKAPRQHRHAETMREIMALRRAQFLDFHLTDTKPDAMVLEVMAPLFAASAPDTAPVGYALFTIDPAVHLYPLIQFWPGPSPTAETTLLRQEGTELVALAPLRHSPAPPLSLRLPLATPGLLAAQSTPNTNTAIAGVDYRGIASLGVTLRVPGTPWILVAKMDESEVYADVHRMLAWIFTGSAVLLALLLWLGRSLLARQDAEARVVALVAQQRLEESLAENERRLRSLGDNLPDSYVYQVMRTPEGKSQFLYLSNGVERVNGIGAGDIRQDASLLYGQIAPEDVPGLMAAETASLEQMKDFVHEFRSRRADGQWRWLQARSHPSRRADGQIVWDGVTSDITRTKQNEAAIALDARRARALLELPALAEQLDETAFMQKGQEFAEDLTGSRIAFIHFVNDDQNTNYPVAQADIWAEALRQGKPVVFNDYATAPGKCGLPEGHVELLRLISAPVIEQGKVVMLAGVGNKPDPYTDVDVETVQLISNAIWRTVHKKRSEQELRTALAAQRKLNQQLEAAQNQLLQSEKMASIGQLAAGVAHELNNPIGFVHSNLGSLEGYLRDLFAIADAYAAAEAAAPPDCPDIEHVHAVKRDKDYDFLRTDIFQLMAESKDGLARVAKIVKDLKDFSRAGEAQMQWADLHQGIDSTLNVVWNELKYKCTVKKEYGDLPRVWCEPSQLNQVFMNLLVNASHAIAEKGDITIRTGRQDAEVFVAIGDTGSGIPPDILKRIFDPFFTTKPVGKGTGLGLSLAYSIVEKNRGRIEVASEVGKGTTFTVWLPIEPATAVPPEVPAS